VTQPARRAQLAETLQSVRQISHDLRPIVIEDPVLSIIDNWKWFVLPSLIPESTRQDDLGRWLLRNGYGCERYAYDLRLFTTLEALGVTDALAVLWR
jgi:hypothetical protein